MSLADRVLERYHRAMAHPNEGDGIYIGKLPGGGSEWWVYPEPGESPASIKLKVKQQKARLKELKRQRKENNPGPLKPLERVHEQDIFRKNYTYCGLRITPEVMVEVRGRGPSSNCRKCYTRAHGETDAQRLMKRWDE